MKFAVTRLGRRYELCVDDTAVHIGRDRPPDKGFASTFGVDAQDVTVSTKQGIVWACVFVCAGVWVHVRHLLTYAPPLQSLCDEAPMAD